MALQPSGTDLYLRYRKPNGASHVEQHRVWNAVRFFDAQNDRLGGPDVKPEDRQIVETATREDYLAQRGR